jgi:hypothetical protein
MENLFNGLQAIKGEIKVTSTHENVQPEINGVFVLQRGNFSQRITYWGRTYRTYHKEDILVKVEDAEYEEDQSTLGELPIDNLSLLKKTLVDGGLKTISDSLGFTNEEITLAMQQQIQANKFFILNYGKKAKVINLLSQEELILANLKYAISHYDECGHWIKKQCGVVLLNSDESIDTVSVPTLEQLKEKLENLKK